MGAEQFSQIVKGFTTANAAFESAVAEAHWDFGHAGYTGTIAEKKEFVMIDVPDKWGPWDPEDYAYSLIDEGDERINDKWGPAGCIDLGLDNWLFFGWASS